MERRPTFVHMVKFVGKLQLAAFRGKPRPALDLVLLPLQRHGDALTDADAHGGERVAPAAFAKFQRRSA